MFFPALSKSLVIGARPPRIAGVSGFRNFKITFLPISLLGRWGERKLVTKVLFFGDEVGCKLEFDNEWG